MSTKAAEIGITATSGFAIVATGGLGRREFVPYSDLDLMLLHDNQPDDVVTQVAEQLWYPLWDANIRLDHSVRTVAEALAVPESQLRIFGKPECRGHRRLAVAVATGESAEMAKERAWQVAGAIRLSAKA